jgi:uncharacterized protein
VDNDQDSTNQQPTLDSSDEFDRYKNLDNKLMSPENARLLSALAHGSLLFSTFIGPLIIYILTGDKFVRYHAKQALNFAINFLIITIVYSIVGFVIASILAYVISDSDGLDIFFMASGLLGIITSVIGILLTISYFILPIIALVKAANGSKYKYPFMIPFVR